MIDFKDIEAREAFRDFILEQLQRQNKTTNWLVLSSGLSKDTICDRVLAANLENKSAPNERTRTRIFDALDCPFTQFEDYYEKYCEEKAERGKSRESMTMEPVLDKPSTEHSDLKDGDSLSSQSLAGWSLQDDPYIGRSLDEDSGIEQPQTDTPISGRERELQQHDNLSPSASDIPANLPPVLKPGPLHQEIIKQPVSADGTPFSQFKSRGQNLWESFLGSKNSVKALIALLIIMGTTILVLALKNPGKIVVIATDESEPTELVLTFDQYVKNLEEQKKQRRYEYDITDDVQKMVIAHDLRTLERKLKNTEQAFEKLREKIERLKNNKAQFTDDEYVNAVKALFDGNEADANRMLAGLDGSSNTQASEEQQVDENEKNKGQEQTVAPEQTIVAQNDEDIISVPVTIARKSQGEETQVQDPDEEIIKVLPENELEEYIDVKPVDETEKMPDIEPQPVERGSAEGENETGDGKQPDTGQADPEVDVPANKSPVRRSLVNADFLRLSWAFNGEVNAGADEIKQRMLENVKKYVEHNKIFKKPEFIENWKKLLGDLDEETLYSRVQTYLTRDIINDTKRTGRIWKANINFNLKFENFINDYIDFAIASQKIGYFRRARHYYRMVLALAPDHVLNAEKIVENNYAVLLAYYGEVDEASDIFSRILKIRKIEVGDTSTIVADTLVNIGNTLMLKNNGQEAFELYEKAFQIDQSSSGYKHVNIVRDLINLGVAANLLDDTEKASKFLEDAQLQASRHTDLDPLHKAALSMNLGIINKQLGKDAIARTELDNARKSMKLAFGNDHVFTLYVRSFAEKLKFQ